MDELTASLIAAPLSDIVPLKVLDVAGGTLAVLCRALLTAALCYFDACRPQRPELEKRFF